MAKSEKVAITLDGELLDAAERLRRRTHESRSALIARALRRLLAEEDHRRNVERYVEAYREQPESAEDVELARHLAESALSSVAWDET